jgi:hypothetical protein
MLEKCFINLLSSKSTKDRQKAWHTTWHTDHKTTQTQQQEIRSAFKIDQDCFRIGIKNTYGRDLAVEDNSLSGSLGDLNDRLRGTIENKTEPYQAPPEIEKQSGRRTNTF